MHTKIINHSNLGRIEGKLHDNGVVQFLGLQYATLQDRFAPPLMHQYERSGIIDATKHGPAAVSWPSGPGLEQTLIQHTLPYEPDDFTVSETECLNLNITVPEIQSDCKAKSGGLPVIVFIHGGSFKFGSGSFPQYDMTRFVLLLTPNIYRLGPFGLMTSKELRDAGYKCNNSLRDQVLALQWVEKHISGFGGDPSNVTLLGESAGAVSAHYHLRSDRRLFRRLVLMSGTTYLFPLITLAQAEINYEMFTTRLGLDLLSSEQRLKALLSMDASMMVATFNESRIAAVPVADNDVVIVEAGLCDRTQASAHNECQHWCEAVMIGDCQFDGSIFEYHLRGRTAGIATAYCKSLARSLRNNTSLLKTVLSTYGIHPDLSDEDGLIRVLEMATDVIFCVPTVLTAAELQQTQTAVYMYRFNEGNPWSGRWKGHAVHILDLVWLLQNFNDFLDGPQKKQAEQFAYDVASFANGEKPWDRWRSSQPTAKIFGPDGAISSRCDHTGRREFVSKLVKDPGQHLLLKRAFDRFMRLPSV